MNRSSNVPSVGTDTPTGTDPDAKYDHAGHEEKSLGQAVNADLRTADGSDNREAVPDSAEAVQEASATAERLERHTRPTGDEAGLDPSRHQATTTEDPA